MTVKNEKKSTRLQKVDIDNSDGNRKKITRLKEANNDKGNGINGGSSSANDDSSLYLIFTTTQSEELMGGGGGTEQQDIGRSTFEGVYTCRYDVTTGQCQGTPMIVTDTFGLTEHGHIPHRGIDVMNLQFITTAGQGRREEQFLYAGYFSGKRDSFEILRAHVATNKMNEEEISFQSFFRTQKSVWKNAAENPLSCDPDKSVGNTYLKVHPRDFVVVDVDIDDSGVVGGDVYLSWDGFYQNCSDIYASKKGLQWTVGVSKLIQSPECTLTDGMEEVKFEDCTEVVSIAYQDKTAYETVLGYAGLSSSKLPNGDNLFFLSALDHVNLDQKHEGKARLYNELWVIKEGQSYVDDPSNRQVFGRVEIDSAFMDVPCDDVGSIQLRKDEDGMATGICRSAYDAGIFCNSIDISAEGSVEIKQSYTYASKEQVSYWSSFVSSFYFEAVPRQELNSHSPPMFLIFISDRRELHGIPIKALSCDGTSQCSFNRNCCSLE
jgi:hypothetical protein